MKEKAMGRGEGLNAGPFEGTIEKPARGAVDAGTKDRSRGAKRERDKRHTPKQEEGGVETLDSIPGGRVHSRGGIIPLRSEESVESSETEIVEGPVAEWERAHARAADLRVLFERNQDLEFVAMADGKEVPSEAVLADILAEIDQLSAPYRAPDAAPQFRLPDYEDTLARLAVLYGDIESLLQQTETQLAVVRREESGETPQPSIPIEDAKNVTVSEAPQEKAKPEGSREKMSFEEKLNKLQEVLARWEELRNKILKEGDPACLEKDLEDLEVRDLGRRKIIQSVHDEIEFYQQSLAKGEKPGKQEFDWLERHLAGLQDILVVGEKIHAQILAERAEGERRRLAERPSKKSAEVEVTKASPTPSKDEPTDGFTGTVDPELARGGEGIAQMAVSPNESDMDGSGGKSETPLDEVNGKDTANIHARQHEMEHSGASSSETWTYTGHSEAELQEHWESISPLERLNFVTKQIATWRGFEQEILVLGSPARLKADLATFKVQEAADRQALVTLENGLPGLRETLEKGKSLNPREAEGLKGCFFELHRLLEAGEKILGAIREERALETVKMGEEQKEPQDKIPAVDRPASASETRARESQFLEKMAQADQLMLRWKKLLDEFRTSNKITTKIREMGKVFDTRRVREWRERLIGIQRAMDTDDRSRVIDREEAFMEEILPDFRKYIETAERAAEVLRKERDVVEPVADVDERPKAPVIDLASRRKKPEVSETPDTRTAWEKMGPDGQQELRRKLFLVGRNQYVAVLARRLTEAGIGDEKVRQKALAEHFPAFANMLMDQEAPFLTVNEKETLLEGLKKDLIMGK